MGASISIDGDEATHDRLRGVAGSYRSALRGDAGAARARACASRATRRSTASRCRSSGDILETVAAGGHPRRGRSSSRCRWGARPTSPRSCSSRTISSSSFRSSATLKKRCDELGVRLWPGNNIGYFGPYESILRGHHYARPRRLVRRGARDARHRGQRRDQGLPVAPDRRRGPAATSATPRSRTSGSEAKPLRYTRDRTTRDLWGYCRTCYYAEECMSGCTWTSFVTLGKPGNNPYCHHRALEMARAGKRERVVQVEAGARGAVRPRGVRDRRRGRAVAILHRAFEETVHEQAAPRRLPVVRAPRAR